MPVLSRGESSRGTGSKCAVLILSRLLRSNLQLSILSRSLQHYYLYQNNNEVQPPQFIGNKVAGILFENKVDHTTFFSPDIEAIQGIHMIPILAPTPFVRRPEFVEEEWNVFFSEGRIDDIRNAWKGIIYASYATVKPKLAWEFFSSRQFDPQWLDGGASLTWFMAFSAGKLTTYHLLSYLPCRTMWDL